MEVFELVKSAPSTDPLSETTRAERRLLLGANLVAIALTVGGLIPSEISALGVALTAKEQAGLLTVLLLVLLYFLAAFLIYGLPEWQHFKADDQLFRQRLAQFVKPYAESAKDTQASYDKLAEIFAATKDAKLASHYRSGRSLRIFFDFAFPLVTSAWSIALLLGAILDRPLTILGWDNPGIWVLLILLLSLLICGGILWRQRWKDQSPTRTIRRTSEEMKQISERMRRALQHPEGSPEREKAKKQIEEDLRRFAERRKDI
jgi:hypothetical protein